MAHDEAGTHVWPRFAARLSLTPATMRRSAPTMGEHNEYAALELAGLDEREYERLIDLGVLRITPPE